MIGNFPAFRRGHILRLDQSDKLQSPFSLDLAYTRSYHEEDLWFVFLGQINDIHSIIVEIFEAAVKVFMWECH